jgi:hypothetical protein
VEWPYSTPVLPDFLPTLLGTIDKILVPELKKFPRGLRIPGYRGNREIPTVYRASSKTEFRIQIFSEALNKRESKRFAVVSL